MIRPLTVTLALCLSTGAQAEGLTLSDDARRAFGEEVRAAILEDPTPVERALFPSDETLYEQEAAADRARLDQMATLFAPTDRGFGADDPRLTIVFFETYPCTDCAAAWTELEALVDAHPDIRVEPRFAANGGAAQLLLSLLDREGVDAYRTARTRLMQAQTDDDLAAILTEGRWIQDRMLRPAPGQEAEAFRTLELDSAPAIVFPDMMLQGSIPLIVLEKYVTE